MVAAPALTPAFTGYDPATFPVRIERPAIQPAGYAFSIWGLIYLWLLAHAAFGLLKRRNDPAFLRPALPLLVSGLLGSVWLAIASSAPITATLVILVMGQMLVLLTRGVDLSVASNLALTGTRVKDHNMFSSNFFQHHKMVHIPVQNTRQAKHAQFIQLQSQCPTCQIQLIS